MKLAETRQRLPTSVAVIRQKAPFACVYNANAIRFTRPRGSGIPIANSIERVKRDTL